MTAKFSDTHEVFCMECSLEYYAWGCDHCSEGVLKAWTVCGCQVKDCYLDCDKAIAASCGECEGEGELNYTINEDEMQLMDCEYCDGTGLAG